MNGEVETTARGPMDIRRVMAALPHRYPMLLIDRVVSLVPNQSIHAIKAVSVNEPFFQGHFPTRPIMPGVLIIEAMAQLSGILGSRAEIRASSQATVCYLLDMIFEDKPLLRKLYAQEVPRATMKMHADGEPLAQAGARTAAEGAPRSGRLPCSSLMGCRRWSCR